MVILIFYRKGEVIMYDEYPIGLATSVDGGTFVKKIVASDSTINILAKHHIIQDWFDMINAENLLSNTIDDSIKPIKAYCIQFNTGFEDDLPYNQFYQSVNKAINLIETDYNNGNISENDISNCRYILYTIQRFVEGHKDDGSILFEKSIYTKAIYSSSTSVKYIRKSKEKLFTIIVLLAEDEDSSVGIYTLPVEDSVLDVFAKYNILQNLFKLIDGKYAVVSVEEVNIYIDYAIISVKDDSKSEIYESQIKKIAGILTKSTEEIEIDLSYSKETRIKYAKKSINVLRKLIDLSSDETISKIYLAFDLKTYGEAIKNAAPDVDKEVIEE